MVFSCTRERVAKLSCVCVWKRETKRGDKERMQRDGESRWGNGEVDRGKSREEGGRKRWRKKKFFKHEQIFSSICAHTQEREKGESLCNDGRRRRAVAKDVMEEFSFVARERDSLSYHYNNRLFHI